MAQVVSRGSHYFYTPWSTTLTLVLSIAQLCMKDKTIVMDHAISAAIFRNGNSSENDKMEYTKLFIFFSDILCWNQQNR